MPRTPVVYGSVRTSEIIRNRYPVQKSGLHNEKKDISSSAQKRKHEKFEKLRGTNGKTKWDTAIRLWFGTVKGLTSLKSASARLQLEVGINSTMLMKLWYPMLSIDLRTSNSEVPSPGGRQGCRRSCRRGTGAAPAPPAGRFLPATPASPGSASVASQTRPSSSNLNQSVLQSVLG